MKRKLILAGAILFSLYVGIVIGDSFKQPTTATSVAQTQTSPPTVAELLTLVNAERAKVGVAPLVEDARLDASAQYKASDMAQRNYFGHYDPSNPTIMNGVQMGYTVTNHDTCKIVSENITENIAAHNTAKQAVYSWVQSPPHHKAMIDAKYTLTGFGIAGNQIVEHFCEQ